MAARKRTLAAFAAGALVAPLTFTSPAFADHIQVRDIETACPTNQLPENPFPDVQDGDFFNDEITCIAEYDVAEGKVNGEYDPEQFVLRSQMAVFLSRILEEAGETLDTSSAGFTDIGNLPQDIQNRINAVANAGIAQGRTATTYVPNANVRRDQMASFIARLQTEGLGRDVSTSEDFFDDDDANEAHEDNINLIASEGIANGTGGDRDFGQELDVTRAQMAGFLARKLDLLVEEEIIEARFGAPSEVAITETEVTAGDPITGSITEAENIDTVSVSGDCVTAGPVTDSNAGTADTFEFRVPTRANATAGDCVVTFTVTFDNGRQQVLRDTVRIAAAGTGVTARPELTGATVVSTTTQNQAAPGNAVGTRVRYTFDEALLEQAGAGGVPATPNPALFYVFSSNGTRINATEVVDTDGSSVLVRFASIDTAAAASGLTLATVDFDAVRDAQGNANPEGDAPLGTTSGGGTTPLPAGVTTAPDLVSVGNFRAAATAGQTAVDFTFDEAAFIQNTNGFSLVTIANANGAADDNDINGTSQAPGTAVTGTGSNPSGGTQVGGNGTTTITVVFTSGTVANPNAVFTAADVARGTVDVGTVSDAAAAGVTNPLQAADVSNAGNTAEPDLVSVELRPATTAGGIDQALFTFDQPVDDANETLFNLYTTAGVERPGTAATNNINTANRAQVLVSFGVGGTADAVGGSVEDSAVTVAQSPTNLVADVNEQDEVGVANTSGGTAGQTAGRTDGPDLTAVAIARAANDPFGNPGNFQATYTFDEDVDTIVATEFSLYLADGTRLQGTTASGVARTEENDNTVTITGFFIDANNNGVNDGASEAATSAQIGSARLGTVDDGAVNEEGAGTLTNPEGAAATTGFTTA